MAASDLFVTLSSILHQKFSEKLAFLFATFAHVHVLQQKSKKWNTFATI